MQSDRNWAMITSGATFESLATTLIFFEDSKAALFGRSGKDGGQDARSGDGLRVFQAKHHEDGSAATAIADAKREAAKIAGYRTPNHARYQQWVGVKEWRLVTNATFNPTDLQNWNKHVVPLFAAQGLNADYWERANLDALLDKHPEVDRAFFGGETRAFLSLPEALERVAEDEPFLQRNSLPKFVGRDAEVGALRVFLSSSGLFLVVHGTGGVGKTRFLLETGKTIASEGTWQVLWANISSMTSSTVWFESTVLERQTLLIVDEPADEHLLQTLSEQLGSRLGRAKWKVAVAVRSPKDPVLRFLSGPRMRKRVTLLAIDPLPESDAEALCADLFGSGPLAAQSTEWRQDAARSLAKRFSRYPVWLTLAVHVLETRSDLSAVPDTAADLADTYLDEVISQQTEDSPEDVRSLLRGVALIGTVNREDETSVKLLVEQTSAPSAQVVLEMLARLVKRRGLTQRGARDRLVELKPDVLRDHVLITWLARDVGFGQEPMQPSDDARAITKVVLEATLKGSLSPLGRAVFAALGQTEALLRYSGRPVQLLDPFFDGLYSGLSGASVTTRMAVAEALIEVAAFRPRDVIRVSQALRGFPPQTETVGSIFGPRDITQDDVVLDLAWTVFHAAMGAETEEDCDKVLEELCALTEREAEIGPRLKRGLPNDGKRAAQLVGKAIVGGRQFSSEFDSSALRLSLRVLERFATRPASTANTVMMETLLDTAMALEREQITVDGYQIHIQRQVMLPNHPRWMDRTTIHMKVREMLADASVPQATRAVLWKVLCASHRSVNVQREHENDELRNVLHAELLDNLRWARDTLRDRRAEYGELTVARPLWDWHCRFDNDEEIKQVAEDLERVYASNDLARELEPLLSSDDYDWEKREKRLKEKAKALSEVTEAREINGFLDRAAQFLGEEYKIAGLGALAWNLGTLSSGHDATAIFVQELLAGTEVTARTEFATLVVAGRVSALRTESPGDAFRYVKRVFDLCGSDGLKAALICRIYGAPSAMRGSTISAEEYAFVRSLAPIFQSAKQAAAFLSVVGWGFQHEWQGYVATVESFLRGVEDAKLAAAITALMEAVYRVLREINPIEVPSALRRWLLDQCILVPDLDDVGGKLLWHVDEILKKLGKESLVWLPPVLARRRDLEVERGRAAFHAAGRRARVSRFVEPVTEASLSEQPIREALNALVDLVSDNGTVGYYLPEILRDGDPLGLYVPSAAVTRLGGAASEDLRRLARIARVYAIGSPSWRVVAKAVLERTAHLNDPRSFFATLGDRGVRSWSGTPGEVPKLFIESVRNARESLERETEVVLRPFWEWSLSVAEAELKAQEEEAKEERGV